jgi:DNA-binding NtrC family response regulator
MLGRWFKRGQKNRADKQQGDRTRSTSRVIRGAASRTTSTATQIRATSSRKASVVISGPGGAPQEDLTPEERRERARD